MVDREVEEKEEFGSRVGSCDLYRNEAGFQLRALLPFHARVNVSVGLHLPLHTDALSSLMMALD